MSRTSSAARRLLISATVGAVVFAAVGSASATVSDEPIWLEGVTFADGTSLTGEFSLNTYGYNEDTAGWFFSTSDGTSLNATSIAAFDFLSAAGTSAAIQAPAGSGLTYEVNFNNGSSSEQLYLTFAHALDVGGPDPLIIGPSAVDPATPASGECAGYSCSLSDERLITGGFVEVAEPTSLTLLGAGIFGFGMLHHRRRALAKSDDGGTAQMG
jgi:hypothetical protein